MAQTSKRLKPQLIFTPALKTMKSNATASKSSEKINSISCEKNFWCCHFIYFGNL